MSNKKPNKKWSTIKVNSYMDKLENGEYVKDSPFHDNNPLYRKANIVFEYTHYEVTEIAKCAKDIIYFANNYCYTKTDEGVRKIILRDYQVKILKSFAGKDRYHILNSARQVGKCFLSNTQIVTCNNQQTYPAILYYEKLAKKQNLTFLQKCKLKLYKLLITF